MPDKTTVPAETARHEGASRETRSPFRMIIASTLPKDGMPIAFEADAQERAALAARLDIPAVDRFEGEILVVPWRGDGVRITGRLSATVTQTSVVTLDPLRQGIEEAVELTFVPEHSRLAGLPDLRDGELLLDPEGEDGPDTFSNDRIDFGEALTEILALGLDPYPREQDLVFGEVDTDPEPDAGAVSPFEALRRLKPSDD